MHSIAYTQLWHPIHTRVHVHVRNAYPSHGKVKLEQVILAVVQVAVESELLMELEEAKQRVVLEDTV